jgi:SRSO17 transposase
MRSLDRGLYLPREWTDDPARCRAAGIPEAVTFATKPELARRMVERALEAGARPAWVVADAVYGADSKLRTPDAPWVTLGGRGMRMSRF